MSASPRYPCPTGSSNALEERIHGFFVRRHPLGVASAGLLRPRRPAKRSVGPGGSLKGPAPRLRPSWPSLEEEIAALANERLEQLAAEAAVQQERQSTIKSELEIEIFSADLPPEIASDLFKLQSDATSARDQYTNLVDRADDLAVTARTQVADSRIVARATIPGAPAGPNRRADHRQCGRSRARCSVCAVAVLADFVWGGLTGSDDLRVLARIAPLRDHPEEGVAWNTRHRQKLF